MIARTIVTIALALALLAGCGSGSDESSNASVTSAEQASTTTEETAVDPDGESAIETTTTTGPVDLAPRPYDSFELADIAAGSNPTLAWNEVAGAVHYRLVVLDSSGSPYWAWSGSETSVPFGATEESSGNAPRVSEGMTWMVSAHDAEGNPLAVSEQGALEP